MMSKLTPPYINAKIPSVLRQIICGLTDLVFPPNCLLCKSYNKTDSSVKELCPRCLSLFEQNHPPFCPRCSRHMGSKPDGAYCHSCRQNVMAFDFAWCACLLNDALLNLLHQFKYNGKTQLRRPLAQQIMQYIETYCFDIRQFDLIVPVPLFHSHFRERGYNQSHLLGKEIARHTNIPCHALLIKTKNTRSQTECSAKERWTNVAGAFKINQPEKIENKTILVVDDLLTTGATTSEAARTLKAAGAGRVGVVTVGAVL